MTSQSITPIKARLFRIIKLDACGNPVTGASSAVAVTKGFVQVKPSPQYEDGTEFVQKNTNGDLIVNDKDPASLKRVNLEISMCVMNPDVLNIITGSRMLTSGGATGTGVAVGEGALTARYSLETWQPASGAGACATGLQQYLYWAFGNVGNSQISDFTFDNGIFTFVTKSETKAASTTWSTSLMSLTTGLGANAFQSGEHFVNNITTVAPPSPYDGAVLLS